ncbi:hypothetical protein THIOKS1890006 [Thiocapsa sp. KS1]|nr:RAMP superfamily CRISPR-associated protein [Thiocapsa sp. KS1]CRI67873.1 hypothetical protein THIOKS1890006 [Thiocapsa sp. KS1]
MGSIDTGIYSRVRIMGQLECRSPMHVGDGTDQPFKERHGCDHMPSDYRAVCVAADGKPYIPATTLRGHLRDLCPANLTDRLFGRLSEGVGQAGQVRLFDAVCIKSPSGQGQPLWDSQRCTSIQHGIAIKPITGTAGDHLLFSHELVPVGTCFSLRVEADGLDQDALAVLLGLLASFDGRSDATIGRGATRMQGRLRWSPEQLDHLSADRLAAWLADPDLSLEKAYTRIQPQPVPVSVAARAARELKVHLRSPGHLLINEPGLVSQTGPQANPTQDDDQAHEPDLEFSRTPDGKAKIPASSLRGLLRGRARRILVSIAAGRDPGLAGTIGDELVGRLFGTTGQRGRVWASDAIADSASAQVEQTFVAIDRFTGGGERHKLYQARAARGATLSADLRLDERSGGLEDWEKALLLLVARDALEGDLSVGWGKSRGYGALEVELEQTGARITAWATPQATGLLDWVDKRFGRALAQTWIDALHREVDARIQAHSQHPGGAAG